MVALGGDDAYVYDGHAYAYQFHIHKNLIRWNKINVGHQLLFPDSNTCPAYLTVGLTTSDFTMKLHRQKLRHARRQPDFNLFKHPNPNRFPNRNELEILTSPMAQ